MTSLYLGRIETVEKIKTWANNIRIRQFNLYDFLSDKLIPIKEVTPNNSAGK